MDSRYPLLARALVTTAVLAAAGCTTFGFDAEITDRRPLVPLPIYGA